MRTARHSTEHRTEGDTLSSFNVDPPVDRAKASAILIIQGRRRHLLPLPHSRNDREYREILNQSVDSVLRAYIQSHYFRTETRKRNSELAVSVFALYDVCICVKRIR